MNVGNSRIRAALFHPLRIWWPPTDKVLEIANGIEPDRPPAAGRDRQQPILAAGGSPAEYGIAVKAAIEQRLTPSIRRGAYLSFTQTGADLFA